MLQFFSPGVWIYSICTKLCRIQLSELSCLPGLSKLSSKLSSASTASAFLQFRCESRAIFTWSKGAISTESHHLCYKSWTVMLLIGNDSILRLLTAFQMSSFWKTRQKQAPSFSHYLDHQSMVPRVRLRCANLHGDWPRPKESNMWQMITLRNCSLDLLRSPKKEEKTRFTYIEDLSSFFPINYPPFCFQLGDFQWSWLESHDVFFVARKSPPQFAELKNRLSEAITAVGVSPAGNGKHQVGPYDRYKWSYGAP